MSQSMSVFPRVIAVIALGLLCWQLTSDRPVRADDGDKPASVSDCKGYIKTLLDEKSRHAQKVDATERLKKADHATVAKAIGGFCRKEKDRPKVLEIAEELQLKGFYSHAKSWLDDEKYQTRLVKLFCATDDSGAALDLATRWSKALPGDAFSASVHEGFTSAYVDPEAVLSLRGNILAIDVLAAIGDRIPAEDDRKKAAELRSKRTCEVYQFQFAVKEKTPEEIAANWSAMKTVFGVATLRHTWSGEHEITSAELGKFTGKVRPIGGNFAFFGGSFECPVVPAEVNTAGFELKFSVLFIDEDAEPKIELGFKGVDENAGKDHVVSLTADQNIKNWVKDVKNGHGERFVFNPDIIQGNWMTLTMTAVMSLQDEREKGGFRALKNTVTTQASVDGTRVNALKWVKVSGKGRFAVTFLKLRTFKAGQVG